MKKRCLQVLIVLLAASGLLLGGQGTWIRAKAILAQVRLQRAWNSSQHLKKPVRAWPWADTWPVARLRVPRYNQDLIVLAGQAGATLAFGPGMLPRGAAPGQAGTCVLAGHRDTSFRFLQHVQPGDTLFLEDTDRNNWTYRVTSIRVLQAEDLYLLQQPQAMLALITCYPFTTVRPGSRQRLLILAALDRKKPERRDKTGHTRETRPQPHQSTNIPHLHGSADRFVACKIASLRIP